MQDVSVSFNPVQDVYDFHKKFGFELPAKPILPTTELFELKARHLREEALEFYHAPFSMHLQLDALVDVVYVAIGAAILAGYPFEKAWRAVHAANMTKVRAERPEQSTRSSTFDVIKPPNFTPPNIERIIHDALNLESDHS